ncbi:BamA/TamA family outer membrane protein [Polluticoccus soli]|uniref:translocation and assembly module lipoprotein TamL n=1 Tax=Polluticoccus soli TaxID=3034150 RepID=UPI0023E3321D|nr:BamA/TamA family outer membrane protein [Flavipsychrobacter sp. JY13-12]
MSHRRIVFSVQALSLLIVLLVSGSCNITRHLKEGEYLLKSNDVKLHSKQNITRKGEIRDNLEALIVQKPNTKFLGIPYKLIFYNWRYNKFQHDSGHYQVRTKTVEAPVIYDSASKRRSALNMRSYLFNQGYFYSKVTDTTKFKDKKAYVTYFVNTGSNYLINNRIYDIDDSTINSFVLLNEGATVLKPGIEFTYTLLEEERTRLITVLRNQGYYKISNNNISFELDTANKRMLRSDENLIEDAINVLAFQKNERKPTLDIKIIIRADEDPSSYYRYGISRVRVFPDYKGGSDFRDTTMIQRAIGKVTFKYHDYYIRENIIYRHLFLEPDRYYSQKEYDQTVNKLNELGSFQSIRISFSEDTTRGPGWLNANVFLTPAQKFDFNTNLEVSNGSIYQLGNALSVSLRNRNFGRGGNMLTLTAAGGIEMTHDTIGKNFIDRFHMLTRTLSVNAGIDFPKFLLPFRSHTISKKNIPRTEINLGTAIQERVKYFTVLNSSANFRYKWRETSTKNWELTPIFANVIRLPVVTDSFNNLLRTNSWLRNAYTETFIEGENVAFIFTDREKRLGKNYFYARLGLEEAGGILRGLNTFIPKLDSSYSQYLKFDFDAQHFVPRRHSAWAFRFIGGIGLPYGNSITLPYLKQYYVGGGYSMRGFRIRTLGPGSYVDVTPDEGTNVVDRTGDIRLELNGEYRFDVVRLFGGAMNLKSALFADAGNIWLADSTRDYPDGEFQFKNLGRDIAINVGTGARIDVAGFFLVRADVGIPIKRPFYLPDDEIARDVNGTLIRRGWALDEFFGYKDWAKQNLVLTVSIGYPF